MIVIIHLLETNNLPQRSVLTDIIPSYEMVNFTRITHVFVCAMAIIMVTIISNPAAAICYRYDELSVYISVYSNQTPSYSSYIYLRACFIVSLAMFDLVLIHLYLTFFLYIRRMLMAIQSL